MIEMSRDTRKKVIAGGRAFIAAMNAKGGKPPFEDDAYYVTLDGKICSMNPYRDQRQARAAAKRFDKRANFTRGAKLNAIVKEHNWKMYKEQWGHQNALPSL